MRRALSALVALTCAAVVVVLAPAAAHAADAAGPDLAGRWNSASLRMDDVGYTMRLAATGTPERYDASLRMIFQDGRRGRLIDGTVSVNGSRATLRIDGARAMRGSLGMDGSLYFPTCHRELAFVPRKAAGSMCLFQEFPR